MHGPSNHIGAWFLDFVVGRSTLCQGKSIHQRGPWRGFICINGFKNISFFDSDQSYNVELVSSPSHGKECRQVLLVLELHEFLQISSERCKVPVVSADRLI